MEDYMFYLITDEDCPQTGDFGEVWPDEDMAVVGRWHHHPAKGDYWVTVAIVHIDDAEWIARALTDDEVSA